MFVSCFAYSAYSYYCFAYSYAELFGLAENSSNTSH